MKIKQLTWRLILPLTIISFGSFTKWWYVLPDDAPDTMMAGFPLAFVADGWFTSMSLQIFLIEFIFDFIIYFLFCFLIVFLIKGLLTQINISKVLARIIWTFAILTIAFWFMILSISEKHIKAKRDWEMKLLVTGYKVTWLYKDRPAFSKYDLNKK
ncbi:MAG: hypothetical protein ABIN25_05640 [Ginsengibacter sp.]